jgi:hypothetical protein
VANTLAAEEWAHTEVAWLKELLEMTDPSKTLHNRRRRNAMVLTRIVGTRVGVTAAKACLGLEERNTILFRTLVMVRARFCVGESGFDDCSHETTFDFPQDLASDSFDMQAFEQVWSMTLDGSEA